jgi:transaldolase / glucose-6-phosphate isomerase
MNPLKALNKYGQSVWLDYIRRSLILSGELERLVNEDGLSGITSNPVIFEKAITSSNDYANVVTFLERQHLDASSIYEHLAVRDIQDAADVLWPVYEKTDRRDGFVSIEVSPYLARDTAGTVREATRLWQTIGRDNVMVKVPGTAEGIPAVRELIAQGINVNVTLLFHQDNYQGAVAAYLEGLEELARRGGDISHMAGVASFFVSRIDAAIDAIVDSKLKKAAPAAERLLLRTILGRVAISNAKLAYQRYKDLFSSERWRQLADRGARTQRLLWASTSPKSARYRDVMYVEELVGPDTVNTMPPSTLDAFRDHGRPRLSLEEDVEGSRDIIHALPAVGISMEEVTEKLLADGVRLFADALDKLLIAVDKRCKNKTVPIVNRQTYALPDSAVSQVRNCFEDWRAAGKVRRLWARDATLWTGKDESNWLGWLDIVENELAITSQLFDVAEQVKNEGLSHALLLGMGGSSLSPDVLRATFGRLDGYPELVVLDSTDPAQIGRFEKSIDFQKNLCVVSSKSGTTLETSLLKEYFFEHVRQAVEPNTPGRRFITITDPRTKLHHMAEEEGFRHIFFGVPTIGGRYSALSNFGMAPAAIIGMDVRAFLDRAQEMVHACVPGVPVEDNPGAALGIILGTLGTNGRDKPTIVASPRIASFGGWLEQLIAESTGKDGRGLIPVDGETPGPPGVYDTDRLFIYLRLTTDPDPSQDAAVDRLQEAGQPVVRISLADAYDLGQEFFRWEMAIAVAASIIGVNPFDQPDVEATKIAIRELMDRYERTGSLPPEEPALEENGIRLFGNLNRGHSLVECLREYLDRIERHDYFVILAYVDMNASHDAELQTMRHLVRDDRRVATCLAYGPRYLHSTGQLHKGGPNTGVFLQITADDVSDLPVPGKKVTFGVVKAAQARADFHVLTDRGRRVLRVHLGADVKRGLLKLCNVLEQSLSTSVAVR